MRSSIPPCLDRIGASNALPNVPVLDAWNGRGALPLIPIGGMGRFLAYLIAQTPSFRVAMKAGLNVKITARHYIAAENRWVELGQVHEHNESIKRFFGALLTMPKLSLRLSIGGVEVERANY